MSSLELAQFLTWNISCHGERLPPTSFETTSTCLFKKRNTAQVVPASSSLWCCINTIHFSIEFCCLFLQHVSYSINSCTSSALSRLSLYISAPHFSWILKVCPYLLILPLGACIRRCSVHVQIWNKLEDPAGFDESKLKWKEYVLKDVAQIKKILPFIDAFRSYTPNIAFA